MSKLLNPKQLQDIANILRRDSIVSTTAAGSGHPTSCMSMAEIMAVLYFHEMKYDPKNPHNENNDEFILSKGHAAPILYSALFRSGCIGHNLKSLRKLNSPLEGHPMPRSLPWVKVATGSLGQGLSVGVGMALAAKLSNRTYKTYVLLGDGEISEGSVYEALQLASYHKLNNLIAIVDVNRLGQRGKTILGHKLKAYKKRFSSFGWKTLVINGHNINQLLSAFNKSNNSKIPTVILAKTFKGHGFKRVSDVNGWHGKQLPEDLAAKALEIIPNPIMPKFSIELPKKKSFNPKKGTFKFTDYNPRLDVATRDAYGNALANLTKADSLIVVVDGEVSNSTRSGFSKKNTPKQFIEAFIAEQDMIGISLGLSKKGFSPFASTFSAFLTRAHDQIRMSALSSANFNICGSHSGVSIGPDGASQMGLEDISMFRALPNSSVFYPSDAISCEKLTLLAARVKGISYIRTTRGKTPIIYKKSESFPLGEFKVLKQSTRDKAVLVGSGITVHEALKAHEILKQKGINTAVVDIYCIKPFNHDKFNRFVKNHGKRIVLAEDHYKEGGIGEMIASGLTSQNIILKHLHVEGIPHSGKPEQLLNKYGIDSEAYVRSFKGDK